MKTYKHTILIAFLAFFFLASCEDWLDVTPQSTLKMEDLFQTQQGFTDVLHGVYIGLMDDGLYGRELTFGMLDAMAQYWTNIPGTPNHRYRHARLYQFEAGSVKPIIDNIWRKMYNQIANLNILLDHIDDDPDLFTGNNYARIKGEALALRAFIHFELLRLFGPVYSEETRHLPGIPYVDTFTNTRIPFSSLDEVFQRVEQDLLAARELLAGFDIMGPESEVSAQSSLQARKCLMNHHAATYLLARLNLYKGQHDKVLQYFDELTTEQVQEQISWSSLTQFYFNSRDEWIFNLHVVISFMRDKYTDFFDLESANQNNLLTINLMRALEIYEVDEGGANDIRYLEWVSKEDNNEVIKYFLIPGFPTFKLAELYLMAAEASMHMDPSVALGHINTLRNARNLEPLDGTADVFQALYKESKKEFLGEGKMFFFYKRHGFEFISGYGSALSPEDYIFPIPEMEFEFNPL